MHFYRGCNEKCKSNRYVPAYNTIYTEEEIIIIKKKKEQRNKQKKRRKI